MVNSDWKREWPKKAGWYWIFGTLWGNTREPEYQMARVQFGGGNIPFYTTMGTFIYEHGNHNILWCKAELPTPPIVIMNE